MKEYIEREAVRDLLENALEDDWETDYALDRLSEIPAADVREVVRGKWIRIDKYDKESNVQCSVCFEEFDYIDGVCYLCHGYKLPLFCPNCGADMRQEVDDDSD